MVHTFNMHGLRLALDVESGTLHVLDEPAYFAVTQLASGFNNDAVSVMLGQKFNQQVACEVLAEIDRQRQKGQLFSKPKVIDTAKDVVVKALCLHLAHDCNLRCRYCFAGSGSYGGNRSLMTPEVAKKSVDFLIEMSGKRRHCEIDFFGGEPLLNFNALMETVNYGRRKEKELGKVLKFTVTTNAFNFPDKMQEYLNREDISVVLSLDGRQEVHDSMRKQPGGGGSYDTVLENCKRLVSSRDGDNYYLRGTYTRKNLDFSNDVLAMISEGFKSLSLEPAVLTPGKEETLRIEDLPYLEAEYEKLVSILWEMEEEGNRIHFFHFELDLEKGPCVKKRASGCGAGMAYLAVAPDGSLFPCHQFVGMSEFYAGHVDKGLEIENLAQFQNVGINAKKECKECFARFFCGGGCHASAWMINGSLLQPYALGCSLHRKRVECGLYLQARRLLINMGR